MICRSFVKKGKFKNRNLSQEKKPPRAQIFSYFRYESRNNSVFTAKVPNTKQ